MRIILSSDEIKRLLSLAVSEGWLEPDCNFTPDVESIEFDAEETNGIINVTAIIDIGAME